MDSSPFVAKGYQMTPDIIKAVLALIGVLFGSIPTYFFMRRKSNAEIEKIKAETEKIKAEAERIRDEPQQRKQQPPAHPDIMVDADEIGVFTESQSTKFHQYFENLLENASRIVLIGTGLNVIQNDLIRNRIFEKSAKGECDIEIYLADPDSPAIEHRLVEEELGKKKPPVAYTGLISRLESLLSDWEILNSPEKIKLNLFSNYPTFALLIIDDKYFFYPYGFATLGNFSPVFQVKKTSRKFSRLIRFLDDHYQLQKKHSVELKDVFSYRRREKRDTEGLHQLAIYFVPPAETNMYKIGSEILGYDIRNQKETPTQWGHYVGGAGRFGFHLTVCDALYFLSKPEIEWCIEEVKFLAKKFHAFTLSDLQVKKPFPNKRSISIAAKDTSGSLEVLHHELVHRVYRRAIGSNYTFKTARTDRDDDSQRVDLMNKYYNAPYILKKFCPHLTLLTNVDDSFDALADEFDLMLEGKVETTIQVEKLAILTKGANNDFWTIREEIPLVK